MQFLKRYAKSSMKKNDNFILFILLSSHCLLATGFVAKDSLLREVSGAVAISTDAIDAVYFQALENDLVHYVDLGWQGDMHDLSFAPGISNYSTDSSVYVFEDPANLTKDIAFENRKTSTIKQSQTDMYSLHEALIISEIKGRSVNPKEFDVDLENF